MVADRLYKILTANQFRLNSQAPRNGVTTDVGALRVSRCATFAIHRNEFQPGAAQHGGCGGGCQLKGTRVINQKSK